MAQHSMTPPPQTACEQQIADWVRGRIARQRAPVILGIGGPGGTGKSTFAVKLQSLLPAALLSLDDFRLPRADRAKSGHFGSHPAGNDIHRLQQCIAAARAGIPFTAPVFDRDSGAATTTRNVAPAPVLICDGEIAAHDSLAHLFDHLLLVTAHWRTQLNTRLSRDVSQNGTALRKAITVFLDSNLRDYPLFSKTAAERADWILYRNQRNSLRIQKCPDECRLLR